MLVLTRRAKERILIGDNIELVVVSIQHGRVRLGIECPRDTLILRKELEERPLRNKGQYRNRDAAQKRVTEKKK